MCHEFSEFAFIQKHLFEHFHIKRIIKENCFKFVKKGKLGNILLYVLLWKLLQFFQYIRKLVLVLWQLYDHFFTILLPLIYQHVYLFFKIFKLLLIRFLALFRLLLLSFPLLWTDHSWRLHLIIDNNTLILYHLVIFPQLHIINIIRPNKHTLALISILDY